jgi:CheY-like chemotaxis protein
MKKDLNILVIDDSETVLETLCDILEEESMHAVGVRDSERAMGLCKEFKFDLVICDVYLPESATGRTSFTGGMSVIMQLNRKFPTLPILAISGAMDNDAMQKLKRIGARTCLNKPFSNNELLATIEELCAAPVQETGVANSQ